MSKKIEYKKDYKHLYMPKNKPEIIDVPEIPFLTLRGSGDPNEKEFSTVIEALYSLSYAVRMSHKGDDVPEGYYEYTVFPLEGIWDLVDYTKPATDKSNFKYTMMIRQPDFLTEALFERFLSQTKKKKDNPLLDNVQFESITDGLSCQMMHIGSYDDEAKTFEEMEAFCEENGYERASKLHREIYISDFRRTEPSNLKTVLRFSVKKV